MGAKRVEIRAPWGLLRGNKAKTAFSLQELVGLTSEFSIRHAPNCSSSVIRTDTAQHLLVYKVVCRESYSDPKGHIVRMKFDFNRLKKTGSVNDLDVRVSCSCVAPDSWVLMADGTEKMIKDVRPGDMVFTHKGRARMVTHVTSRKARLDERAYQMVVDGYRDPLVLSEDHPVAVVRGHEVCACGCGKPLSLSYQGRGTIQERWGRKWATGHGRFGVDQSPDHSGGRALWRKPPELVEGEQLYFPQIQWAGTQAVDPDLASLVGYYLAEGSLQRVKAKKPDLSTVAAQVQIDGTLNYLYGVSFALNKNEAHTLAQDIQDKVAKVYPEATIIVRPHKTQGGLAIEVKCARMAGDMHRLVGQGSLTKKLSAEVLAWDTEAMLELTASWALGDGYCGKRGQKIATSSKELASQMSTFLLSVGVWHGLTYEDPKMPNAARGYRLTWDYRRSDLLVNKMRNRMREHDEARVAAHLASTHERRKDPHWAEGYIRTMPKLTQVESPSEFYDLTVEEDSSFIANRVLVHNCPAFLFYGAQWNLSTGDALYGAPRPKLQAPTDPKRYQFVVCKHVKVVANRIGPVLERMLGVHRTKQDEEAQKEQQKQVDLVKEQTQHEVDKAEKKERPPITPIVPTEEGELEAMPEKQYIPDKVRDILKLPPISPKKAPEGPEEEMEGAPKAEVPPPPKKEVPPPKAEVPPVKPEAPLEEEVGPKAQRMKRPAPNITLVDEEEEDVGAKAKRMKLPPNITLVDEDEDEPITILPGAKARRMLHEEPQGIPEKKDVRSVGPKARRMLAPKAPAKPRNLPPNLKLIDDDSDDDIVKINRLKQALLLAGEA